MNVPATPARGPLSNFIAIGTSEIFARAAGFAATALLARRLGVDAFGILGLATATVGYLGIALLAGFGVISAREVARNPVGAEGIVADATIVRIILALCAVGAVAAFAFGFVGSPVRRVVLLLTSLSLIPFALDTSWAYRGLGRNHIIGIGLLAAQFLYLAGSVLLVRNSGDLQRVPVIQFAGELVAAGILLSMLFAGKIPRPSIARGMELLNQSGYTTLGRLLRAVIVTFDVILLGIITSDRDVGLYSAAYRVCFLVATIAVATHAVFMPAIIRAALAGAAAVGPVVSRSLVLTSAVVLPIAAGGIVLAAPLLAFLFGSEYADGARAFQILLGSIALLAIHGAGHNVFVALQRNGMEAAIFAAGAALNIALNLVFIPRYGLVGAAAATLAAEALILVSSAIFLRSCGIVPGPGGMVRPMVSAIVMGGLLYPLAPHLHVILLVVAGALIYAGLLGLLGGFPKEFREPVATLDT